MVDAGSLGKRSYLHLWLTTTPSALSDYHYGPMSPILKSSDLRAGLVVRELEANSPHLTPIK